MSDGTLSYAGGLPWSRMWLVTSHVSHGRTSFADYVALALKHVSGIRLVA